MQLSNGKTFSVTVKNSSPANCYIQSVKLNGVAYNKAYITQQDIVNGGKLDFVMGAKPNKSWGTKPDNVPPMWGYTN